MTTTTNEPKTFDTISTFNSTVFGILNGEVHNACYIEFIELCVFYQKMNDHNTSVLKCLSDAICAKYDFVEEVNSALNGLSWDKEDECLYRFMTSFTNL